MRSECACLLSILSVTFPTAGTAYLQRTNGVPATVELEPSKSWITIYPRGVPPHCQPTVFHAVGHSATEEGSSEHTITNPLIYEESKDCKPCLVVSYKTEKSGMEIKAQNRNNRLKPKNCFAAMELINHYSCCGGVFCLFVCFVFFSIQME